VSNISILDLTAVLGSLSVFEKAGGMSAVRAKSVKLTGYVEHLFNLNFPAGDGRPFEYITSSFPDERGAQLAIKIKPEYVDAVIDGMAQAHIIADVRKVDGIMRVTAVPLYNSFADVAYFMSVFVKAIKRVA
jgi:kynureninase